MEGGGEEWKVGGIEVSMEVGREGGRKEWKEGRNRRRS